MLYQKLSVMLLLSLSIPATACINSYYIHLDSGTTAEDAKEQILNYTFTDEKNEILQLYEKNDFAVLHIYSGNYQQAIKLLHEIEKKFPKNAITAANLGTAYELLGDLEKSKYWIKEGMTRDENIHGGSEWIHLKILDAQLALRKDKNWLKTHDVLDVNFGHSTIAYPNKQQVEAYGKSYNLAEILEHSSVQMVQRTRFLDIKEHEPVVAQILFNIANTEFYFGNYYDADIVYGKAKNHGYSDLSLLEKRLTYVNNDTAWGHWKQKMMNVWLGFLAWWAT